MGLPFYVDLTAKTVFIWSYIVYLEHYDGYSMADLNDNRNVLEEPEHHDCRHVRAVTEELRIMGKENCRSLRLRFEESAEEALAIIERAKWKTDIKDGSIQVKRAYLPEYKRSAFMGEAILSASPEEALYIMWDIGTEIPQWNAEITSLDDIVELAPNLRISHQTVEAKLGGLISPRDFLMVTGWMKRSDDIYYLAFTNVTDDYQPNSDVIRGVMGPSIFIFERLPENRTKFTCLRNYELRLNPWFPVPQNVIDKAASATTKDYLTYVQRRTDRPSGNIPFGSG